MNPFKLLSILVFTTLISTSSLAADCTEEQYLQRRPDVRAAGMSAVAHYNNHGINEGMCRPVSSGNTANTGNTCTPQEYLNRRPDVRAAGMSAVAHYNNHGVNEGMCNPSGGGSSNEQPTSAGGDIIISSMIKGSKLVLKTCAHDAGAVCSIKLRGQEFIDDYDHGRQLQSATTFNRLGEQYNPTEAGSSHLYDGVNPSPSTSNLETSSKTANSLKTRTQMAFWNPVNGERRSNHILEKSIKLGAFGNPNIIEYKTRFIIPANENLDFGQIEILTGYMPPNFSVFKKYNPATRSLSPLSDGPGEQKLPVILSTPDQKFAMGIFSGERKMTYGRWRFSSENVVKWNQVTRFPNPAGTHNFTSYVVIGTLQETKVAMDQLAKRFNM